MERMKYPWDRLKKQGDWIQIDGKLAAGVSSSALTWARRTHGPRAVINCATIKKADEEGGPACIVTLVYVPPPVVAKPEAKADEPPAISPASMRNIRGLARIRDDEGDVSHHFAEDEEDEIDPSLLEEPDDDDVEATRLPDDYQRSEP